MIYLYSGTPGSGKSYCAAYKIYRGLNGKGNYICNFDINLENASITFWSRIKRKFLKKPKLKYRKLGRFDYVKTYDLTPTYLKEYANKHHKRGKESQTTIIIDECQLIWNSRTYSNKDRLPWIEFLSVHRHLGFDFILLTQSDRLIDRQIRAFIEFEVKHRKLSNFGIKGKLLSLMMGGTVFGQISIWYGMREKVSFKILKYNKHIASLYDSYEIF